jgi:hypothetical protein
MAMAASVMPGGTVLSSPLRPPALPLRSPSPPVSIPSDEVCGDPPAPGKVCGDPPTSGKIYEVAAARGERGGGRKLLYAVKVTEPSAVPEMEGFTATRFPSSSSTRTHQHLASDVLAGKKVR